MGAGDGLHLGEHPAQRLGVQPVAPGPAADRGHPGSRGALDPGRPLAEIDTLQITPRVAATTRESRVRAAWAVARRIDELLSAESTPQRGDFRSTAPDVPLDLQGDAKPE